MIKDFVMNQMESFNERNAMIKSRIDEHDLKINMVMRNQEHMRQVANSGMMSYAGGGGGGSNVANGNGSVDVENELRLMRGQIQDERTRREQLTTE